MVNTPRPLVAGNWKMNGITGSLREARAIASRVKALEPLLCDVAIFPPFTLIAALATEFSGSSIRTGGQDCHANQSGAYTGDVSAEMIADLGGAAVIVGHSERRADHGETDAEVLAKAEAAWRAGLMAIICVGETELERDAGRTLDVIADQLAGSIPEGASSANTTIAYEPVWAIGTGRTPSPKDVADVHAMIRATLAHRLSDAAKSMAILYGGSVNPTNARELMGISNVDGALVGGASLKAEDFLGIIAAYSR